MSPQTNSADLRKRLMYSLSSPAPIIINLAACFCVLQTCVLRGKSQGHHALAYRLFVVGASIERLRSHLLAVRAGQDDEGVVSANDIMCAILWLMRYPSEHA